MSAKRPKNRKSLADQVRAAEHREKVYRRLMQESARKADAAHKRSIAAEKVLKAVLHKCGAEMIELTGAEIRDAPEYVGQFGVGKNEAGEEVAFYRYVRADLLNTVTIEEEEDSGAAPDPED